MNEEVGIFGQEKIVLTILLFSCLSFFLSYIFCSITIHARSRQEKAMRRVVGWESEEI